MTTKNFKQTKKVGTAGSFQNQIMSNNSSIPVVGQGATQMHYTDRTCFEVVEVSADNKTARLMYLEATCDKSLPCEMGHQNWIFQPTDRFVTITYRNGAWRTIGSEITFTEAFYKECNDKGFDYPAKYLRSSYPDKFKEIYGDDVWPKNVVTGITEAKKVYTKINIIFGRKDYYYDWSF